MSASGLTAGRALARPRPVPRRLLVLLPLALVGLGVLAWRFGPWSVSGFVEYAMPSANDIPTAVAAGPDGTVWFTIESADRIGRWRDGKLETLPKGKQNVEPLGLAVDRVGNVWYTDAPIRSISRLAADGSIASFTLPTPITKLARLAIAPDGAVWFADATANSITRLDGGVFTPHELPTFSANPFGVAVGPDGTVWASLQRVNKLARVAASGEVTEFDIPTRASVPTDVAVDSSGVVWFAEFQSSTIGRFADGRFSEFWAPTRQAAITGLALGPDGTVWFTETRGHKLGRLRDGAFTEFPLPRGDARPFGIAVDQAGNVWYTDISGKLGMLAAEHARAR